MTAQKKRAVYVIGHCNPDTDSICSAIAYAELKNKTTDGRYVPKCAGQINEETRYVLERLGVKPPNYMSYVGTQICDIDYKNTESVSADISLRKAWQLMRSANVATLPITEKGKLKGLITIGDIAKSYMESYENTLLGDAKTPYSNILDTIDGKLIVKGRSDCVDGGRVQVGTANPDVLEQFIGDKDVLLIGNRYDSQLCAIEMNVACIIVSLVDDVPMTIKRLAADHGTTIITSPYDTFTVARLINQSIPISYFMVKDNLVTVRPESLVENVKDTMSRIRHRDYPIVGANGEYIGMVSRRTLLNGRKKQLILVDHNEKSQAQDGIDNAEILEIIDHHRIGNIETLSPIFFRNQPLGCTATIIYQMYHEKNVEICKTIAGLLCAAIISDTLLFRSPTCTDLDREAATDLAGIAGIDLEEFAAKMFAAGSSLKGKSPEEIFHQDFKKYNINGIDFGVGQISSMNHAELADIKAQLIPYMKEVAGPTGVDMLFFMLTDILDRSTCLIYSGAEAKQLVASAFGVNAGESETVLKGVVSRKKQLLPSLVNELQQ